jgi:hypothetical protein
MPGYPLRRTCARPSDGARKSKADQQQIKSQRGGLTADLTLRACPAQLYPCRRCRHVFDAALSRKAPGACRIEKYLKMSKKLIFKINDLMFVL